MRSEQAEIVVPLMPNRAKVIFETIRAFNLTITTKRLIETIEHEMHT